jgi:manganese/zinc/iron transport system permease protein
MLYITILLGGLYALFGFHLATWLNCSIAGAMTVAAGLIFGVVWLLYAIKNHTMRFEKTNF